MTNRIKHKNTNINNIDDFYNYTAKPLIYIGNHECRQCYDIIKNSNSLHINPTLYISNNNIRQLINNNDFIGAEDECFNTINKLNNNNLYIDQFNDNE